MYRSTNYHNQAYTPLLAPAAAKTASFTSASFDAKNFDALTLFVNVGATGDTLNGTNRVELQVQESDDNSAWANVADANLTKVVAGQAAGTFGILNNTTTAVNTGYQTGYRGGKRYVRVIGTNYGTTSSGTFLDVVAIGGRPRQLPINS